MVTEGDRTLDALQTFDEEIARREIEAAARAAERERADAKAKAAKVAKAKAAKVARAKAAEVAKANAAEVADTAASAEIDRVAGVDASNGGVAGAVSSEEREEEPLAESDDDAPLGSEAERAALLLKLELSAAALQERAQKALGLGKDGQKVKRRRRSPRKSGGAARVAPPQFAARDAALAAPLHPSPALPDLARSLLCLAQCLRSATKQTAAHTKEPATLLCKHYAKALRFAEAARKHYTTVSFVLRIPLHLSCESC